MCSAYGREASMRCCVRRSFEAATISMAFVIFCVFFTLLIFVRISLPLAIRFHLGGENWCQTPFFDSRPYGAVTYLARKKVSDTNFLHHFFADYAPVDLKQST